MFCPFSPRSDNCLVYIMVPHTWPTMSLWKSYQIIWISGEQIDTHTHETIHPPLMVSLMGTEVHILALQGQGAKHRTAVLLNTYQILSNEFQILFFKSKSRVFILSSLFYFYSVHTILCLLSLILLCIMCVCGESKVLAPEWSHICQPSPSLIYNLASSPVYISDIIVRASFSKERCLCRFMAQ